MPRTESIPYLSAAELSGLGIKTGDVVDSIEALIRGIAEQSAWSAPKAVILPDDGRYMMAALAATDDPPILAVKTVVLNPDNPDQGLPQINGLVTLLNSTTGVPVAILDGNWITAVRTAGLSATAARYLAREGSSTVAFIGCGVQARSHLQAFADLYPLGAVRLFGRGQANIDRLSEAAAGLSLQAVVCDSAADAIAGADLVVSSLTYSADLAPFVDADWLEPGSFATITDLAAPWHKQNFSKLDRLIIDDLDQEAALPNKLVPPDCVDGDLAGLVLGQVAGRQDDSQRNAFVFRGHAVGDLALSALAFQRASSQGLLD